ncbi:MAG: hypothetical protein HY272_14705 [Gammaproteobacteria bacterium]|nr:hypothetical protein [Gammaproteobacteria bacterium]
MEHAQELRTDHLNSLVREALTRAERYRSRFSLWDTPLLMLNIICGAIATVLAGGTALRGDAALPAFGGWQGLCLLVAVITALGAIAGTIHKSLQISSKVNAAVKCISRLRALELRLATASVTTEDALLLFNQISEEHAECLV